MITVDVNALAEALAERLEHGRPWLTLEEAADYMRFSKTWVRQRLGEIPHARVDGKLLFSRDDLDSYITSHRRERT